MKIGYEAYCRNISTSQLILYAALKAMQNRLRLATNNLKAYAHDVGANP